MCQNLVAYKIARFIAFTLYIQGMDVRDIGEGEGMEEEEDIGEEEGDGMKEVGEDIGEEAEEDTAEGERTHPNLTHPHPHIHHTHPYQTHPHHTHPHHPHHPCHPGMRIVW